MPEVTVEELRKHRQEYEPYNKAVGSLLRRNADGYNGWPNLGVANPLYDFATSAHNLYAHCEQLKDYHESMPVSRVTAAAAAAKYLLCLHVLEQPLNYRGKSQEDNNDIAAIKKFIETNCGVALASAKEIMRDLSKPTMAERGSRPRTEIKR